MDHKRYIYKQYEVKRAETIPFMYLYEHFKDFENEGWDGLHIMTEKIPSNSTGRHEDPIDRIFIYLYKAKPLEVIEKEKNKKETIAELQAQIQKLRNEHD